MRERYWQMPLPPSLDLMYVEVLPHALGRLIENGLTVLIGDIVAAGGKPDLSTLSVAVLTPDPLLAVPEDWSHLFITMKGKG